MAGQIYCGHIAPTVRKIHHFKATSCTHTIHISTKCWDCRTRNNIKSFFFLKAKVISYDDGRSHGHMCSISRDRLHYSKAEKLSRGPLVLLYVGQMKCASSTHTGIKAAIDKLLQVIHTHNILLLFTKFSRNRDFQIWELHNRLTEC